MSRSHRFPPTREFQPESVWETLKSGTGFLVVSMGLLTGFLVRTDWTPGYVLSGILAVLAIWLLSRRSNRLYLSWQKAILIHQREEMELQKSG